MTDTTFTKSSRSGGSGGNCLEWAIGGHGVWVRDSKHPHGPRLHMTHGQWDVFVLAAITPAAHPWIVPDDLGVAVIKDRLTLHFTPAEWDAFVAGARAGECLVPA